MRWAVVFLWFVGAGLAWAQPAGERLVDMDWFSVGLAIPAPQAHCLEKGNTPPCDVFKQVATVGRLEFGRFRYRSGFQWNIASGYFGRDWVGKERIAMGILGVGIYAPVGDRDRHELGVIAQPLSGVYGPTHAVLNTQMYYRSYAKHVFVEVGLEYAVIWGIGLSSGGVPSFDRNGRPIQLQVSVGPRF